MNTEKVKQWFKDWTDRKIELHLSEKIIYYRKKEIWWVALGANIGFEQNGKHEVYERPIVIIKKFNKDLFWGVPLTTQKKTGLYYFDVSNLLKDSVAILSQFKACSSKRLRRRIGVMDSSSFNQLCTKIKELM